VEEIKKRLKSLLTTLKEKKRYLAFEIVSKSKIKDFNAVSSQIMDKSLELIGQLGVARAGIQVLPECWNPDLQRGLIRVGNKHVDELKASLAFIEKIENQEVIIKTIGVSGIIEKAKERYIEK
jgi:ribonuclease P/MRP protein subunit POP5